MVKSLQTQNDKSSFSTIFMIVVGQHAYYAHSYTELNCLVVI